MAVPGKNTLLSSDLFTGRARPAVEAPRVNPDIERQYAIYSGSIFSALLGATTMSDRDLFKAAKGEDFGSFRAVLEEMVRRGLLMPAGVDPSFKDPLYAVRPTAMG